MSVRRTFTCQRCNGENDYWEDKPRCKVCGSRKLDWLPKGGHILKELPKANGYFRKMADTYGLTNLKDAREGEAMMPTPPATKPYDGPGYQPMQGVNMPLQMNNQGQVVGSCQAIPLDQVKGAIENIPSSSVPPPVKMPSLREQTIVEARWSKDKGEQRGDAA